MRRVLKSFKQRAHRFAFTRASSKALPSFLRAMDALVPKKVIREVMASSHDRRQWGTLAAAWVGVSEGEFFRAAAREMGIDFRERIEVPELSVFGPNARAIFAEMRAIGACVELNDARITGFVCVEPAEVRSLSFFEPSHHIAIASWTEVARVLDVCERTLVEREINGDILDKRRREVLTASIIEILVKEARAHGASTFDIVTTDGKTRYQFYTSHGKLALGSIHVGVVGDLLHVLRGGEGEALQCADGLRVLVRSLGSGANFKLSWTPESVRPVSAPVADEQAPRQGRYSGHDVFPINDKNDGATGEAQRTLPLNGDPVLVVDDNPMFCRVLEKLLIRDGLAPYFAANGIEALEKLSAGIALLPKVIICDLHMPLMNGREFLSQVKNDARFMGIPVLVLTSDEDVDAEFQLLQLGAEAFVSKTKDPRVLTSHIQRLVRQVRLREAA